MIYYPTCMTERTKTNSKRSSLTYAVVKQVIFTCYCLTVHVITSSPSLSNEKLRRCSDFSVTHLKLGLWLTATITDIYIERDWNCMLSSPCCFTLILFLWANRWMLLSLQVNQGSIRIALKKQNQPHKPVFPSSLDVIQNYKRLIFFFPCYLWVISSLFP